MSWSSPRSSPSSALAPPSSTSSSSMWSRPSPGSSRRRSPPTCSRPGSATAAGQPGSVARHCAGSPGGRSTASRSTASTTIHPRLVLRDARRVRAAARRRRRAPRPGRPRMQGHFRVRRRFQRRLARRDDPLPLRPPSCRVQVLLGEPVHPLRGSTDQAGLQSCWGSSALAGRKLNMVYKGVQNVLDYLLEYTLTLLYSKI